MAGRRDKFIKYGLRLTVGIAFEVFAEQPIQVMCQYSHGQVKIHFDNDAGRIPVEVKEVDMFRYFRLDQPAATVFLNQIVTAERKSLKVDDESVFKLTTHMPDLMKISLHELVPPCIHAR